MKMLRFCAAAIAVVAALSFSTASGTAHAAGVAYLSGGGGCPFFAMIDGMAQLAAALEARGLEVHIGCNFPISDIARHRGAIVLIGHSYGAMHAADAARALKSRGIADVTVIAIEPLYTPSVGATCAGIARCICFYTHGQPMPHARNVHVQSDYWHVSLPADPLIQARVIAAVGR